jgi:2-oxoglutarate dehydrogenase E1 component
MRSVIGRQYDLYYAGRPLSAAPAVGYPSVHVEQQHALVDEALGLVGAK